MSVERIGVHESVREVFPPERLIEALADLNTSVTVVDDDPAALDGCDAVVTFEHRDAFLEAVGWVHSIQAGVDRFPFDKFERAGVALTNSAGIHGESVGEMVLGYLVALARDLHGYARRQRAREWERPPWDRPFTLAGETLCVVGLGTLGRGIATRADAIGMRVTGVKRTVEPVDGVAEVYPTDALREGIAEAQFVAVAVPLTDETYHLIGPDEFNAMRADAYLINVARGPVVDQDALVTELEAGNLGGAALDVFEEEPLPEDSPLWHREDVLVTPHVAATVRSYYEDVADLVRENVRRVGAGEALMNRVL